MLVQPREWTVGMEIGGRVLMLDLTGGAADPLVAAMRADGLTVGEETAMFSVGQWLTEVAGLVVVHACGDASWQSVDRAVADARPELPRLVLSLVEALSPDACERVVVALELSHAALPLSSAPRRHFGLFVGESSAMRNVYASIRHLAPTELTVLIRGESGTGKELVARAIHEGSSRARGPFVRVNCAALQASLLESELFGHRRGAFTGAVRDHAGRFEVASGGSIFLDEVDSADPAVQGKLLRAIEQKEFERVGETRTRSADVRIISATNADLLGRSRGAEFRPDLYYRLASVEIELPPLRSRGRDVRLLAGECIARLNDELHRSVRLIGREALERLEAYRWPGNVRELNNVLCRALLDVEGEMLEAHHLPPDVTASRESVPPSASDHLRGAIAGLAASAPRDVYRHVIEEAERELIGLVLRETGGNIRQSSHLLGIARNTLKERIRRFDLCRSRPVRN